MMLKNGLETIFNVQLSDTQWKQASPPVHMGGLGVRSSCMLAPSAFVASAAATLPLQEAILSASVAEADDTAVSNIKPRGAVWPTRPNPPTCPSTSNEPGSQSPVDLARLKAVVTPHAGDWLHAPPLTAVGFRLSDEAIRVTIGYRLGTNICQPHTWVCGATVDARGLHGLACRKSGPRHIRHSQLNDLIWRAVKKAQIPASKEPIGLSRADGKRPDGATLVTWTRGKPLAWDVTVPDTYAASHL